MAFGLTRLRPVFAFFSVNFVVRREWMQVYQGGGAPGAFWGTSCMRWGHAFNRAEHDSFTGGIAIDFVIARSLNGLIGWQAG
jgi:hypothetical protein